jgi:Fe-S-cluster-containing hydrogenase component 2
MIQAQPAQSVAWVDASLCLACRYCDARHACTIKALMQIDPGEPPFVDVHRCMGCMDCVAACPFGAILPARLNGEPAC